MVLDNKLYDALKFILVKVIGPLITAIEGLGLLYDWDTKLLVGTIAIIATFIGSVMGVSAHFYGKSKEADEEV